jgi:hypothetical protein
MKKNTVLYLIIGSIIAILACIAAFFLITIKYDYQLLCLKVILGLGAAAFMAALPGTINLDLPKGIHATGVCAIFCIIFFYGIFYGLPKQSSIEMYNVVGYLKFVDKNNSEISAPYQGITFTVTPPKAGIESTGYFHVENIPVDSNDNANSVILTINKQGYNSLDITVDEKLPSAVRNFDIKKEGRKFIINPGKFVLLKKNEDDCIWNQSNTPDYNNHNAITPIEKDSI